MKYSNIVIGGGGVLGSQIAFQAAFCGFHATIWLRSEGSISRTQPKIDKLKETYKCENCSNWGQAFKTANECKLGITDGEYQNGTHKEFYCNKHKKEIK